MSENRKAYGGVGRPEQELAALGSEHRRQSPIRQLPLNEKVSHAMFDRLPQSTAINKWVAGGP